MPEVIGPVRPKGDFPVAYSDEVQAPGGGRTVEARLQELAGIMSAALHPPAVGSVQALVRNYALVIEHAEDLPSDISQVQWRIQGNANSHIGVWTPASSKRIPLYLRASDIAGLLANADETVLQVDFEASRSGRLTIVETLLITIPIGGTATAEGIEEWAHEDAPRQPVPNDRGRLIEPSELGDYQLSGQYAVRAFEGALYGGNGFEEGQIVFNHAPTSGATNVRIKPHIEELALFTRRARAGARITIGGWSADIASVSTSVSGSILTIAIDTDGAVRPHVDPGNFAVSLTGRWREQVDARTNAIIAADVTPLLNSIRNRAHLVVGWGAFADSDLVPGLTPARPSYAFEPTFSDAGAAIAGGRWHLDPAAARLVNPALHPMWRAECRFTRESNGTWTRSEVVYTRTDDVGAILFSLNAAGSDPQDAPQPTWADTEDAHYGFRRANGSIQWIRRTPELRPDVLLFAAYRTFNADFDASLYHTFDMDDYSAFKVTYRTYDPGDVVRYYGEAFLRDLQHVRAFTSVQQSIARGALRAAIGGPYLSKSLEVVDRAHGGSGFNTPGGDTGLLIDFILRSSVGAAVNTGLSTIKVFSGVGAGRYELWGIV